MFSPFLWIFGMLIYSMFTKIESRAKKLRIIALALLYVCSNSFLVEECFRFWEPVTPDYDLMATKYEGAIVLGGVGNIDLRLQKINFNWSGDRLFQIIPYFYKGRIKKIIFTGGSGSIEFAESREGIFIQRYLKSIQLPDSALIVETESKNTYENGIFTKKLLDSLKIDGNFLLVTSAYHMPRAMAVFKKAGFKNLTPYITQKIAGERRYSFEHLLVPSQDALYSLHFLIHEWVGYIVYKCKGYV